MRAVCGSRAARICTVSPTESTGIEFDDVVVVEANAAVGGGLPDGAGRVGAVDAVTLEADSDPARTKRVVRARWDHGSLVVVGGVRNLGDDSKVAYRAGAVGGADRNGERAQDDAIFENGQLAIGQAHENDAVWMGVRLYAGRVLSQQHGLQREHCEQSESLPGFRHCADPIHRVLRTSANNSKPEGRP
jgi:hypothetical protein